MSSRSTRHFSYTPEQMRQFADDILAHAKKIGASDCVVEVDEGSGLTVNVRRGKVETRPILSTSSITFPDT